MIVVADTTPLVHLSRVGRLALLEELFDEVVVPQSVWGEISSDPGAPWSRALDGARWVRVVDDPPLVDLNLDPGETAAILLAGALAADLLLIDERQGRAVAIERGIAVIGTIGIVGLARRRGLIERARPVIYALRNDGLWVSDEVVAAVLADLGE